MTTESRQVVIELTLEYRVGLDEPNRGIYRNAVELPKHSSELTLIVQDPKESAIGNIDDPDLDLRPQVHLLGSAPALEELGRYLVALARLETADPEPYGSIDDVRDGSGGTMRLLPRRISPEVRRPDRS